MFKKTTLCLLFLLSVSFAYQGTLHKIFPKIVPTYLSSAGFTWESDTVEKYMDIISNGAADPDNDHPGFKIPAEILPKWAKAAGQTSIAKWEHCLLDDVPWQLDRILSEVCKASGFKYQYADSCAVQWLRKAEDFWSAGQIDSSMWHLGRTCHLIQDITVPMHTHLTTNLLEAWRVVNHMEPNQEKFEKTCEKLYVAGKREWKEEKYEVLPSMYSIAVASRKRFKFCDGMGKGGVFNYFPLKLLPCLVEDQDMAAKASVAAAEINTVRIIHYFFQRVTAK